MRSAVGSLAAALLHLFFSTIRVDRADRMPATGGVLVVANHHSSLVDPAALLATLPRLPRFLAKSTLWGARYLPLRFVLNAVGAIPVHRQSDGGGDNTGMFAATSQALLDGDVVAIFAEGKSHDEPGLAELRTGAARIALATATAITILPVGLIYDDRATFRSRAYVKVGRPIEITGSPSGDEDRAAVRELTDRLAEALAAVAPSWERWEAVHSATVAAELTAIETGVPVGRALTAINRAVDADDPLGTEVIARVVELERESSRLGLDIETVVEQPPARLHALQSRTSLTTLIWSVPTVIGRVLNRPPYLAIDRLAASRRLNFQATAKILFGVVAYPLWWAALALAAWWLAGPTAAVITSVAVPVLGWISARKYGRLRRLRNRDRVRDVLRRSENRNELGRARSAVIDAVEPVLQKHTMVTTR